AFRVCQRRQDSVDPGAFDELGEIEKTLKVAHPDRRPFKASTSRRIPTKCVLQDGPPARPQRGVTARFAFGFPGAERKKLSNVYIRDADTARKMHLGSHSEWLPRPECGGGPALIGYGAVDTKASQSPVDPNYE